jgi:hypothetical protein
MSLGLSPNTVLNAEKGHGVRLHTVLMIVAALGYEIRIVRSVLPEHATNLKCSYEDKAETMNITSSISINPIEHDSTPS